MSIYDETEDVTDIFTKLWAVLINHKATNTNSERECLNKDSWQLSMFRLKQWAFRESEDAEHTRHRKQLKIEKLNIFKRVSVPTCSYQIGVSSSVSVIQARTFFCAAASVAKWGKCSV